MNVGVGEDLTILELAEAGRGTVGYDGAILTDTSKARRHTTQADGRGAHSSRWAGAPASGSPMASPNLSLVS